MSDSNYGLGFYLIETGDSQYDLYNSVTDKCILFDQPKDKIISFLELNLPTHPFLYQVDQESEYLNYNYGNTEVSGSCEADPLYFYSNSSYDYSDRYRSTSPIPSYNYNFGLFVEGLSEEEDREEDLPEQLEFDFSYEDSKGYKLNLSSNSPSIDDEDLPYLPDYED
jgi:hypothetical protein